MAHSPHRNWKGCALCKPHKRRGQGERKNPWAAQRKLGRSRRWSKANSTDDD